MIINARFSRVLFVLVLLLVQVVGSASGASDGSQTAENNIASVAERRIVVQLQEQKRKNEQQAQALEKEKNELNLLRSEVDKKLDQLKVLRKQLAALVAEKDAKEQERILQLSKMYNKMDPLKAANIISELDKELAVQILGGMKSKSAGRVLANIVGKKAAALTRAYSTLKKD